MITRFCSALLVALCVSTVAAQRFEFFPGGTYDNAALTGDDVNDTTYTGGRVALGWTPTDSINVDATAMFQETEMDHQTRRCGMRNDASDRRCCAELWTTRGRSGPYPATCVMEIPEAGSS